MSYPSARSLAGGAAALHVGAGRVPNPQGPPPPLPSGIAFVAKDYRAGLGDSAVASPTSPQRLLRGGCYFMRYTPLQSSPTQPGALYYLGTLRVQRAGSTFTISGDLYLHRVGSSFHGIPEPDPANGIPTFPREGYRYYLRATSVADTASARESFALGLELFRFDSAVTAWSNDGEFSVELSWSTTPPGYPSEADYLTGHMRDKAGTVAGTLCLGWVSTHLRRATIEIDSVHGGEFPRHNGNGLDWSKVFNPIGWDVTVIESDTSIPEPTGESWADAEMHEAMIRWRDQRRDLLDLEWRYHILCVRRLDETERGIMYDASATDSNYTPREGIGLACDWCYPKQAVWGRLQGSRFGSDNATYFRTAVHELGHALGLYHNTSDNGYMNTTDVIARRAQPQRPFPDNILWGFNPDDEKRLRHMPDLWVRPGGLQFGEDYAVAPIAADDLLQPAEGLRLAVKARDEVLPLGAPARIEFELTNQSDRPLPVPQNLSLRGGSVRGKVVDPSGTVRAFLPLVQCVESQPMQRLAPAGSVHGSLTLIRGPQGALFPAPGLYRVFVEIHWEAGAGRQAISATAELLVMNAQTLSHATAAFQVLSTPDTLLTVAASSKSPAGMKAIDEAASEEVLAPHYAWLSAKRLMRTRDPADTQRAVETMARCDPVLSRAEAQRALQAFQAPASGAGPGDTTQAAKPAKAARDAKADAQQAHRDAVVAKLERLAQRPPGHEA